MPRKPAPSVTAVSPAVQPATIALALGVLTAGAYLPSLAVPPILDDWYSFIDNPSIRSLSHLRAVLLPDRGPTDARPLLNLSFALNYAVGGSAPWGYHLVNLAIHVAAALVLFGLVRRSLGLARQARLAPAATWIAAAAASLWALHPLATESVTYASQRSESLAGLFVLGSLYAFVRGVAADRRGWLVLSVLCVLGAVATKETSVTTPVVIALFDLAFVGESLRATWMKRRWYYAGLAASWVVLAVFLSWFPLGIRGIGPGNHVTALEYLAIEARGILIYLGLALLPIRLAFDYGPIPADWHAGVTLPGLVVAGLFVGSVLLWRWSRPSGFLAVVVFVLLSPTSSVVPIVLQPIAESRMYLPLAALASLAAAGLWLAFQRWGPRAPRRYGAAVGVAAVVLAAGSYQRNCTYASGIGLWRDTVEKIPGNPRAHDCLGNALALAGHPEEARLEYQAAVTVDPTYVPAQFNLGVSLLNAGDARGAAEHLARARQGPEHQAEANLYLGQALLQTGQAAQAVEPLREALRLAPANGEAAFTLGGALGSVGRYAEAAEVLAVAVRLEPDQPRVRNNYGNALLFAGRTAEAVQQYQLALQQAPGDRSIRDNLEQARRVQAAAAMRRGP